MGCSNSKEAAIAELQAIVSQISLENSQLIKDCDKLKAPKEVKLAEEKNALKDLNSIHSAFSKELNTLNAVLSEISGKSKAADHSVSIRLQELIEIEEKLKRKVGKVQDSFAEREDLRNDQEKLESQIAQIEAKILEIEKTYFPSEDLRSEYHALHVAVAELESKKEDLLEEIEKAEEVLTELNEEMKASGIEDIAKATDPSNYEVLLSLSDPEVVFELKKVDSELEELNEQLKALKVKEAEVQAFEKFSNLRSVSRSSYQSNSNIRAQIKSSQDRVEVLESEKLKVKEEIIKLKNASMNNEGLSEKITALNEIIDKKKNDTDGKGVIGNLMSSIEQTLKRAKLLDLKQVPDD